MARNDKTQQPGSRPRGGPESTEPAYEQATDERNDLPRQAGAQPTPEPDEADRAYRQSRGARGERDNRPG